MKKATRKIRASELIQVDFAQKLEDAFIRSDRNKMSLTSLKKLVHILEERSKRDR